MIQIQDVVAVVRKHHPAGKFRAAADARRAIPSVFKSSLILETPSKTRSFSLSTLFFRFIRPVLFIFPGQFFSPSLLVLSDPSLSHEMCLRSFPTFE